MSMAGSSAGFSMPSQSSAPMQTNVDCRANPQLSGGPDPFDFLQQNMSPWSGAWGVEEMTPVARPSAKKKAKTIDNATAHGKRVRLYVEATQLWERLDTDNPTEHGNPETGFSADAIELARRGREHVRVGLEESTMKAYNDWRSLTRTHTRHGGNLQDLHEEYYVAVRNYGRRFATGKMQ